MYISHSEELKNYVYICLKCVQCNTVAQISFCFESTSPQVCSTTTTTTTTRRRTSNKQQPSHHPLSPPPQKKTATCYMFKLHRRHCSRTGMQAASAICFCTWLRFWWSGIQLKVVKKRFRGSSQLHPPLRVVIWGGNLRIIQVLYIHVYTVYV